MQKIYVAQQYAYLHGSEQLKSTIWENRVIIVLHNETLPVTAAFKDF